ncbi:hypothetical protein GWA97_06435 [Flavobacterium sp. LaA7.5]|nr:hypothetical protein [Flavobacterium salilacus subsp. altitudinum]
MINKFLADIQVIKNAINTKKLVVFAGAGISIDAGVPGWGKLIEEIKNDLDLPGNEVDYLKIPQIYYNERQEKEYIEKIRKVLKHKKLRHNEIHEEIFELHPEHILTTNFEDLLEQVINKKSLPFSVVKEDKDLPYSHNTKLLVKIHGDLDNTDFVLKEDDYLNYSINHPLIEAFIKSTFASKVVLFIGYSYNDYNLKQIIHNVRNILGNSFQNAYLLSTDKKIHLSQKEYLKNKGINVVDYFDADFISNSGQKQNYILDFLKGNNYYKEKYLKSESTLSDKGQLLYNFLKFIRHYDDLKIKITKDNVINQIFKSLERFSELKSLPQDFIANLYPFKTSHKNESLLDRTTLLLKNKIIVELFYDEIHIEDNKLVYKPQGDRILDSHEIKHHEEKILSFLSKLNNSIIYHVTKENSKADSFGNKGFSRESKSILINTSQNCQCAKCRFERFELNQSLSDLNNYNINEISDLLEDSKMAYLNYKFGNYIISFKMFEEIASKAWNTGKYITYYIAKRNMKTLKNLINYGEDKVNEDEKEKIIYKIADIDTDKLIFQIPYKSNEEYKLLKIIRDDTILLQVKEEIDELYSKIEKTYKSYKNQYYNEVGPYYPHLIFIQLYQLLNFYTDNYLISDAYTNFRQIIQKGIESLILSHSTSKSYGGRLKELPSDFFWICTMYSTPKSLIDFLNDNEIQELKFDENDISKIIDYSLNYFNSFFTKSSLYFNNSYKNELILNQLSRGFSGRMSSYFSNMMILFLSIDIPSSKRERFVECLLYFLEYENFLQGDNIKYLNFFLEKNYSIFSKEDCLKLVKIAHDKMVKYERYDTLDTIAYIASKNEFEILVDKKYVFKVLSDYDYYNSRKNVIVPLFEMSNSEIKKELQLKVIDILTVGFKEELYVDASKSGMLDYNLFFIDYLEQLNNEISPNDDDGYENVDGKLRLNSFNFYNALIFLYKIGVKSTDSRLEVLTNLSPFMKFFIFREKSDFTIFKVEWLLLINSKVVYKEISKIKALKKIVESYLKSNYNEDIAKIYTKYFI